VERSTRVEIPRVKKGKIKRPGVLVGSGAPSTPATGNEYGHQHDGDITRSKKKGELGGKKKTGARASA